MYLSMIIISSSSQHFLILTSDIICVCQPHGQCVMWSKGGIFWEYFAIRFNTKKNLSNPQKVPHNHRLIEIFEESLLTYWLLNVTLQQPRCVREATMPISSERGHWIWTRKSNPFSFTRRHSVLCIRVEVDAQFVIEGTIRKGRRLCFLFVVWLQEVSPVKARSAPVCLW